MKNNNNITGYQLSRDWFDFTFSNPEKIRPIHTAIYFFAIEHCNRLGWKSKFGFPSQMVMEAIGIKNWRTYSKALNEIVDFGFIIMIETSKNQYSSNIIAIVKNTKATTKALDKALSKHSTKHSQSIVSIDKQVTSNNETNNSLKEKIEKYLIESFTWKKAVIRNFDALGVKLDTEQLNELIILFCNELEMVDDLHKADRDNKAHCSRWIKKYLKDGQRQQQNGTTTKKSRYERTLEHNMETARQLAEDKKRNS